MTPQDAINLFTQLIEQTRLLPAEYRQLQEALRVLDELASKKQDK